jgi:tRNA(fMet)-specific endonuclease VapC
MNASDCVICSLVVQELLSGVYRSASPAVQRAKADFFLGGFRSLPFDDIAADAAAQIGVGLSKLGTPIGPYDLQVAGIARANGLTVVTHNTAEFARVPELAIEDWESA